MRLSRPATAAWRRADSPYQVRVLARDCRAFVPHDIYSRKSRRAKRIRVRKAISKAISGAEGGICYASALCFAVRLELLGAKTSPQDSNCRYEK
jgi:hypothetical protein